MNSDTDRKFASTPPIRDCGTVNGLIALEAGVWGCGTRPLGRWRSVIGFPLLFLAGLNAAVSSQQAGASNAASLNSPFVIDIRQVGELYDPTTVLPSEISAVAYNIYDWLFDRSPDGKSKSGVAESWSMSPDATELIIKLRPKVMFHDGSAMTSGDVVFSWGRMVKGGFSTRVSRSLQTIEALDAGTVRIKFGKPEVGFIASGGFAIVSKAYFEKMGEQEFKLHPQGTGPYKFTSLVRGRYADLERFEGYWGVKPEIKTARFNFVTEDSTRVAQLKTGEADLAMQIPYPSVGEIVATPTLKIRVLSPGGFTIFLALKTDNPKSPWADIRVREAMAIAIDHDAIVKDILRGYPKHFPLLAPSDNGYDPDLKPYAYDPARAKLLLKEAGATDLQFELPYISGASTGIKETAEAVALYLGRIGIKAVAKPIEGPQFIGFVHKASKNPDMDYVAVFIGGIAGTPESSGGLLTQFSTVTPFAWYVNPEINMMALKMAGIADPKSRAESIKDLGRAVHGDMRYIPLWTTASIYSMKKCVDFVPTLGPYDMVLLRDIKISGCGVAGAN